MNIPEVTFKTRTGDDQILGGGCSIGGEWKNLTTDELFKNKKVVLFSLPGAYTPVCSSQQLKHKLFHHQTHTQDCLYLS